MRRNDDIKLRTDLGKRTHQCDETQGNNSTQALSTKIVYFGCKKIDNKSLPRSTNRLSTGQHATAVNYFLTQMEGEGRMTETVWGARDRWRNMGQEDVG